jgi:hypothetical protein
VSFNRTEYDIHDLKRFLEEKRTEFSKMRKDGWIPRIAERLKTIEKLIVDLQFDLDSDNDD